LLDTLINPEVEINRSLVKLHGIKKKWLYDAPTLKDVREYASKMFSKCVFVGHSVIHDLKCFGMTEVRYADTSYFEDKGGPNDLYFKRQSPKRLKDLVATYLNGGI
jgi:DNA polymerase III epsilon subunit-like protein